MTGPAAFQAMRAFLGPGGAPAPATLMKARDEKWLSNRLEWLLTPTQSHGFGVSFPKRFAELVARRRSDPANHYARRATFLKFGREGLGVGVSRLSLRNASVSREWHLPRSARRGGLNTQYCDVVLQDFDAADSFLLVIENKLFMPPSEEQLSRYEEAVSRHYQRLKVREFVLLTLYPRPAETASGVQPHWVRLSWTEDILDLLNGLVSDVGHSNEEVLSLRDLLAWHRMADDPQRLSQEARETFRDYLLETLGRGLQDELERRQIAGRGRWLEPDTTRRKGKVVFRHTTQPASCVEVTLQPSLSVAVHGYRSDRASRFEKVIISFGSEPAQVANQLALVANDIYRHQLDPGKGKRVLPQPASARERAPHRWSLLAFVHEHRHALRVLLRHRPSRPDAVEPSTPGGGAHTETQLSMTFLKEGAKRPSEAKVLTPPSDNSDHKQVGGEFFQLDKDGNPTDTALHAAILGADDQFTYDPMDPKQAAARRKQAREWLAQRRAKQAKRGAR